jgi:hypothetical protein
VGQPTQKTIMAKHNQCNLHHQPPKGVISIPDMPMPCIKNAKYDNPQAIQYRMRQIRVNSVSEFTAPQFRCKELPLPVSSTPKSHYQ